MWRKPPTHKPENTIPTTRRFCSTNHLGAEPRPDCSCFLILSIADLLQSEEIRKRNRFTGYLPGTSHPGLMRPAVHLPSGWGFSFCACSTRRVTRTRRNFHCTGDRICQVSKLPAVEFPVVHIVIACGRRLLQARRITIPIFRRGLESGSAKSCPEV